MNPDAAVKEKVELKPRRPRLDGLTYTAAELAWALGISIRQLRRIQYRLPSPIKALSRQPKWSREEIRSWVEGGGRARR